MAAGDHDGSVSLKVEDGIVEQRSGGHADVNDLAAAGFQSADQSVAQTFGTEATIAAEVDLVAAMPPQIRARGAAEELNVNVAQFFVRDAANIVLAKDGRVEHYGSITWRADAMCAGRTRDGL